VIVNVISPAPKDIWDKVLAEDPFALEGQASAGTMHCAGPWVTETPAGCVRCSTAVSWFCRSSCGWGLASRCSKGSNPAYCGVGGILASRGSRSIAG
jgi:hypothetical protein